ncbi:hypothetical protein LTR27_004697 [Elasticomyces elasticus]|nr:hypothetical protein LTR27_004697 [Elasticomyces elasticus]
MANNTPMWSSWTQQPHPPCEEQVSGIPAHTCNDICRRRLPEPIKDQILFYHPHGCDDHCRAVVHPTVAMQQPHPSYREVGASSSRTAATNTVRSGSKRPRLAVDEDDDGDDDNDERDPRGRSHLRQEEFQHSSHISVEANSSQRSEGETPANPPSERLVQAYDALILDKTGKDPPLIEMLKMLDIDSIRLVMLAAVPSSKTARESIRIRYWQAVEAEEIIKTGAECNADALGGCSCFSVSSWPPMPLGAATKAEAKRHRQETNKLREHYRQRNFQAEWRWPKRGKPDWFQLSYDLGYSLPSSYGRQRSAAMEEIGAAANRCKHYQSTGEDHKAAVPDFSQYSRKVWHILNENYINESGRMGENNDWSATQEIRASILAVLEDIPEHRPYNAMKSATITLQNIARSIILAPSRLVVRTMGVDTILPDAMRAIVRSMSMEGRLQLAVFVEGSNTFLDKVVELVKISDDRCIWEGGFEKIVALLRGEDVETDDEEEMEG